MRRNNGPAPEMPDTAAIGVPSKFPTHTATVKLPVTATAQLSVKCRLVPVFTATGNAKSNGVASPNPAKRATGSDNTSNTSAAAPALTTRTLLSDGDGPPVTQFTFDNVEPRTTAMMINLNGRLRVDFRVFSTGWFDSRSDPRTVKPGLTPVADYEAKFCELVEVNMTAAEVTGKLMLLDIRLESWPARRVTKAQFPGVFLS